MAIKHGTKIDPGSSSASMTDLMFLLLIFLMIATTMINTNALKLELPQSTNIVSDKVMVIVSVTPAGEIFVDEQQVQFDRLEPLLKEKMQNAGEKVISLQADKSVPIGTVVDIWNIAKRNDFKINLATQPE